MLTSAVSFLHITFDILAFKNDVSFWRKRDSLEVREYASECARDACAAYGVWIFLYIVRILLTPKYNVSDGMQQGLSLRSLFWAAGSELILFFYLIEEKSSKLVCAHARVRACVF